MKRTWFLLLILAIGIWALSACSALPYLASQALSSTASPTQPERNLLLLNDAVDSVDPAAMPGLYTIPWDATPDPSGEMIYFTARTAAGGAVLRVDSESKVEILAEGEPLVAPQGLTVSHDGTTLYVADPGADAIFTLPIAGGEPVVLAGSEGTVPRNLEVTLQDGVEVLYISGVEPGEKHPALLLLVPGQGSNLYTVWAGAPLTQPEGVAVAVSGVVYVANRIAPDGDQVQVYRLQNGNLEALAGEFSVGMFVGAALTPDDALLLVSALHPTQRTAEVMVINTATGEQALVNKGIGANRGSGGVHRAHDATVLAWADLSDAGNGGKVYRIKLR